jgi:hypothetical protein
MFTSIVIVYTKVVKDCYYDLITIMVGHARYVKFGNLNGLVIGHHFRCCVLWFTIPKF